jgi:hypothetical protein
MTSLRSYLHQGWSDHQPLFKGGLTASLCIVYGQIATRAGQTASTFNGRILNLKVAVAIVMI